MAPMTEPQSGGTAAVITKSRPEPRQSFGPQCLKLAVIVAMLVTVFLLFQYPLHRINSDSEINFNEGWNAYRQDFARQGIPLYGAPPDLLTGSTNYPPASFHIVGLLSGHGDVVKTARWISVLSLIATGILIALIIRQLGADPVIAAFTMLLYVLGITVFLPDRVGMDDPQLLAEVFTTAGLYLYIRARKHAGALGSRPQFWDANLGLLCGSAFAFCLAGFTKQNLLAFPAAVGLDLLFRSRRRFLLWCGAMLLFAALFTGLTFALDGRFVFAHLFPHRAYSFDAALNSITRLYLQTFQGIMLVALVWALVRFRSQPLLAMAFVFSNTLAFVLSGGDGVDLNIFFNAFTAAVIICGVALAEIENVVSTTQSADHEGGAPPFSAPFAERAGERVPPFSTAFAARMSAALMLALFLSLAIRVPERLHEAHLRQRYLADDDTGFRAAADLVRITPGPALCESLLLCYRAGKPYEFDTYTAIEEIKSHHSDVDASLPLVRSRHFAIIQLDAMPGEAMNEPPTIYRARSRFTPEFVDALLQNYRLALRTSHMLLFVSKGS